MLQNETLAASLSVYLDLYQLDPKQTQVLQIEIVLE